MRHKKQEKRRAIIDSSIIDWKLTCFELKKEYKLRTSEANIVSFPRQTYLECAIEKKQMEPDYNIKDKVKIQRK